MKACLHPIEEEREPRRGGVAYRCIDELHLAALAMWRNDEAACDLIRDFGAEIFSDDVETEVHAGSASCGGENGLLVDVEDVGFDCDGRESLRELIGVAPVRGRALAVEQARGRHNEDAGADGDESCAALVGLSQRVD